MNFDEAAPDWDKEERRRIRARVVAARIEGLVVPRPSLRALDFGCGTGLLSFLLRDLFAEIVLLDPSAGMIDVLRGKISRDDEARKGTGSSAGADMLAIRGTIEPGAPTSRLGLFDYAYTMLALHHIEDTESTLEGLASILSPGGILLVVELDKEDGGFHRREEGFNGHDGFDRAEFAALVESSGFARIGFETVWVERRTEDGAAKEYPMFLLRAERI